MTLIFTFLLLAGLDTRGAHGFSELSNLVQDFAKSHPDEKRIIGFGTSSHTLKEQRLPTAAELDKMTERPLLIVKYDGHAAIANTAFINSLPSRLLKDGFDCSKGHFYHNSFYNMIDHVTKTISLPKVLQNMVEGMNYLAGRGIGFVHACEGVGFPFDLDVDLLRWIADEFIGEYLVYMQTMDVKKVLKRKMPRIGGCFSTALDGCFGSLDAALTSPYQNQSENSGILFHPSPKVNHFVEEAHRQSLQVALHAIGDAAVDQALHAYSSAIKKHDRPDHRHILIHACLLNERHISEIAKHQVAIATQTPFLNWELEPDHYLNEILGKRADQLIPLKSIIEAGILLGNGSDAPCTLPDPIQGIHMSCNHPVAGQRVDILTALRMHTIWNAKLSFLEDELGSLEIGKRADFVVLEQNPLTQPTDQLNQLSIKECYYKGELFKPLAKNALRMLGTSLIKRFIPFLN